MSSSLLDEMVMNVGDDSTSFCFMVEFKQSKIKSKQKSSLHYV